MRDTPGVESRSSKPKRLSTVLLQAHESKPAGKEGFRHLAELRILRAGAHAAAGVHQAKYSRSLQPVQSTKQGTRYMRVRAAPAIAQPVADKSLAVGCW